METFKVYKTYKWQRDWSYRDGVIYKKYYLKNKSGNTIFASENGVKLAIDSLHEQEQEGWIIEVYEGKLIGEIRDKRSYQECLCDHCPFSVQTTTEDFVCTKTQNIIGFTSDWWAANCPLKSDDGSKRW